MKVYISTLAIIPFRTIFQVWVLLLKRAFSVLITSLFHNFSGCVQPIMNLLIKGMRITIEEEGVVISATLQPSPFLFAPVYAYPRVISLCSLLSDLKLDQATRKQNMTYNTKANLAQACVKRKICYLW